MALYHIYKKTQACAAFKAADPCFTTMVPSSSWTNTRLGTDTPRGVLGGMIATISGDDYTVNIATASTSADFFFYNDASGAPFENAPAVASGKISLLPVNGAGDVIEIDVYETNASGGASVMSGYVINADLYVSARGLVTSENTSSDVVGKVVKVPTTANPRLGIKLA